MISKSSKIFNIEDKKYQFNFQAFLHSFNSFRLKNDKKHIKVGELEEIISTNVNVSIDAVHNWRNQCNGPSDVEIIKGIAQTLEIQDFMILLKEVEVTNNMNKLNIQQTESLKRIYDSIIDFLDDFEKTGGFTTALWYRFVEKGSVDPEWDICEYAEKKINLVRLVISKEYFYLHNQPIYDELINFVENELINTFDGKLGYAYRFEAIPDGNPTTEEDYLKALNVLNSIIEKYI